MVLAGSSAETLRRPRAAGFFCTPALPKILFINIARPARDLIRALAPSQTADLPPEIMPVRVKNPSR